MLGIRHSGGAETQLPQLGYSYIYLPISFAMLLLYALMFNVNVHHQ